MSETKPLHVYRAMAHVIWQVRFMDRFFDELAVTMQETSFILPTLRDVYMNTLNKELAPEALLLAIAIRQLEDAYPEIKRGR